MQKAETAKTKWALSLAVATLLLFTVIIMYGNTSNTKTALCVESYDNNSILKIGSTSFNVDISATEAERSKGLSGKKCIPENQAMLFVFERPDTYGFWMKDMNFSIDMIWLNADKKVVHIQKNATPESYPQVFKPNDKALYVIEVASGTSDKLNIAVGTQLNF